MSERASMNTGHGLAAHNDLTCDSVDLEHVDLEKSAIENIYCVYDNNEPRIIKNPTKGNGFFSHEMKYYDKTFSGALEHQRKVYADKGQARYLENCTMDNWYKNKTPEEQIYQYGNLETETSKLPTGSQLYEMVDEQARWEAEFLSYKHFVNENGEYEVLRDENGDPVKCENTKMVLLDLAVHMGEASPHAHVRKLYLYKDENGNCTPGNATKCYQEAGIEVPYSAYDEMYYDENGNPEAKLDDSGNILRYRKGPRKNQPMYKTVVEKHFEQIKFYRKDDNGQYILDDDGNKIIDSEMTKTIQEKCVKQVKRVNCEKSSWDAIRRKHWQDILDSRGFEVEREPLEPKSEVSGLADKLLDRYVTDGKKVRMNKSKQKNIHAYRREKALETNIKAKQLEQDIREFDKKAQDKKKEIDEYERELKRKTIDEIKQQRDVIFQMAEEEAERIKAKATDEAEREKKRGYSEGKQKAELELKEIRSEVETKQNDLLELIKTIQTAIRIAEAEGLVEGFEAFAKHYKIRGRDGQATTVYDFFKSEFEIWQEYQARNRERIEETMRKAEEFMPDESINRQVRC